MESEPLKIGLIGWGAIARALAGHLARHLAGEANHARIVAVAVRDTTRERPALPPGARLLRDPAELAECGAALVIEAAGRDSVAPWGRAALATGADFAVSSVSAFADAALLRELTRQAQAHGPKLLLPPGALGGIDALRAARHMGLAEVEHRIVKPARAWRGTEAEALCQLDTLTAPCTFFIGNALQAASRFPQNANVAMTTALAGLGPEHTRIALVADPQARLNRHEIIAAGDFGTMALRFENAPLPENPKSSAMTALSLMRLVENHSQALVI